LVYKIKSDQYYIEIYNSVTYTRKMSRAKRSGDRNQTEREREQVMSNILVLYGVS
jgi:hypothetical protein